MAFTRTNILQGPAKVAFGGGDFFGRDGVTLDVIQETFDLDVDAWGVVGQSVRDKMLRLSFIPTEWNDLAVLFPYGDLELGSSIFAGTDSAAVITPINGAPITLINAAITAMPSILLSSGAPSFSGAVQLTGLIGVGDIDTAAVGNYYTLDSPATAAAISGFVRANIKNAPYLASYNSVQYNSEAGFAITPELSIEPVVVDGIGTVDYRLTGLSWTCTALIPDITEAAALTLTGFATAVGQEATRHSLTVQGTAEGQPQVTFENCDCKFEGFRYARNQRRCGQFTWRTAREESSGAIKLLHGIDAV